MSSSLCSGEQLGDKVWTELILSGCLELLEAEFVVFFCSCGNNILDSWLVTNVKVVRLVDGTALQWLRASVTSIELSTQEFRTVFQVGTLLKVLKVPFPKGEATDFLFNLVKSDFMKNEQKSIPVIHVGAVNLVASNLSRRNRIVEEIIATERTYVDKLLLLVNRVLHPLEHLLRHVPKTNVTSVEELSIVSSNIETILKMSQSLLSLLNKPDIFEQVGDVMCKFLPYTKQYVLYFCNHTRAKKLIDKMRTRPAFAKFWTAIEQHIQSPIEQLLILPVQRLPRYELFLEQLVLHSSENHLDVIKCREALELSRGVNKHANRSMFYSIGREKVYHFAQLFKDDGLMTSGRFCIFDDKCVFMNEQKFHAVVFNDSLLLVEEKKILELIVFDDKVSWLYQNDQLLICCTIERKISFTCSSSNRASWEKALTECSMWQQDKAKHIPCQKMPFKPRKPPLIDESTVLYTALLGCWEACGQREEEMPSQIVAFKKTTNRSDVMQNALTLRVSDHAIFVCFRATDIQDVEDIKTNVNTFLISPETLPSACGVHKGFWTRIQSLDVEAFYRRAYEADKQLIFCGHSLGGALAHMCFLRLLFQFEMKHSPELEDAIARTRSIGFGSPQIGNAYLQKLVHSPERIEWSTQMHTFVAPNDPIVGVLSLLANLAGSLLDAYLPCSTNLKFYVPIGSYQILKSASKKVLCSVLDEALLLEEIVSTSNSNLSSHGMLNYVKLIMQFWSLEETPPTYYDELGVDANVTLEQLKAAVKKLRLLWHPDKRPRPDLEPNARQKYERIEKAYKVLKDPDKRELYNKNTYSRAKKPNRQQQAQSTSFQQSSSPLNSRLFDIPAAIVKPPSEMKTMPKTQDTSSLPTLVPSVSTQTLPTVNHNIPTRPGLIRIRRNNKIVYAKPENVRATDNLAPHPDFKPPETLTTSAPPDVSNSKASSSASSSGSESRGRSDFKAAAQAALFAGAVSGLFETYKQWGANKSDGEERKLLTTYSIGYLQRRCIHHIREQKSDICVEGLSKSELIKLAFKLSGLETTTTDRIAKVALAAGKGSVLAGAQEAIIAGVERQVAKKMASGVASGVGRKLAGPVISLGMGVYDYWSLNKTQNAKAEEREKAGGGLKKRNELIERDNKTAKAQNVSANVMGALGAAAVFLFPLTAPVAVVGGIAVGALGAYAGEKVVKSLVKKPSADITSFYEKFEDGARVEFKSLCQETLQSITVDQFHSLATTLIEKHHSICLDEAVSAAHIANEKIEIENIKNSKKTDIDWEGFREWMDAAAERWVSEFTKSSAALSKETKTSSNNALQISQKDSSENKVAIESQNEEKAEDRILKSLVCNLSVDGLRELLTDHSIDVFGVADLPTLQVMAWTYCQRDDQWEHQDELASLESDQLCRLLHDRDILSPLSVCKMDLQRLLKHDLQKSQTIISGLETPHMLLEMSALENSSQEFTLTLPTADVEHWNRIKVVLEQIANADSKAFQELFHTENAMLYSTSCWTSASLELAKDLLPALARLALELPFCLPQLSLLQADGDSVQMSVQQYLCLTACMILGVFPPQTRVTAIGALSYMKALESWKNDEQRCCLHALLLNRADALHVVDWHKVKDCMSRMVESKETNMIFCLGQCSYDGAIDCRKVVKASLQSHSVGVDDMICLLLCPFDAGLKGLDEMQFWLREKSKEERLEDRLA